jgi:hypothetical protein
LSIIVPLLIEAADPSIKTAETAIGGGLGYLIVI